MKQNASRSVSYEKLDEERGFSFLTAFTIKVLFLCNCVCASVFVQFVWYCEAEVKDTVFVLIRDNIVYSIPTNLLVVSMK